ncbi:MAG TPA: oxidoreductase [Alphaproteobacteria bacterium]|jgi:delta1-piperideine-2-carboxylate reductase|nr:MAG: oxidoreductase [SAR116 cluster bacterium MED-G05]HAO57368.1 oxidoreductase [Alphaproteobacteria bacterium]HBD52163.1 oxidoreductase [Alphaproteobacteria bacterium]HBP57956.1 oxidoreductase [Alphaproteobacteria bacterium]HCA13603.1 oxidoreductase [Alphaproteobacteria bacterium]|tara:strand:+ start:9320 stop:10315 length:996 start_codon:yes stop_codon:yes gene_type:complete
MSETSLSLDEIYALAHDAMTANGCNDANAGALADIVMRAERDGSHSHGLFRVPGYVKALRSGKVDGKATPTVTKKTPAIIHVDGHGCFAPLAQAAGLPVLAEATAEIGVAALSLTGIHHFAALWPETEFLADRGLVGIACTAYMPMVAPSGTREKLFGTNPISFAWPRPGKTPVCYDMATAAMAMGDVQIAARDGKTVPLGTGLDAEGNETTDPAKIAAGVLLPFGGYKGSAIALMVELLAAGLTGEQFSYEAKQTDNGDGGPPRGGEMVIGLSPALIAGDGWESHVEAFMDRMTAIDGVRIPGARRHQNRLDTGPRAINSTLVETIRGLI